MLLRRTTSAGFHALQSAGGGCGPCGKACAHLDGLLLVLAWGSGPHRVRPESRLALEQEVLHGRVSQVTLHSAFGTCQAHASQVRRRADRLGASVADNVQCRDQQPTCTFWLSRSGSGGLLSTSLMNLQAKVEYIKRHDPVASSTSEGQTSAIRHSIVYVSS